MRCPAADDTEASVDAVLAQARDCNGELSHFQRIKVGPFQGSRSRGTALDHGEVGSRVESREIRSGTAASASPSSMPSSRRTACAAVDDAFRPDDAARRSPIAGMHGDDRARHPFDGARELIGDRQQRFVRPCHDVYVLNANSSSVCRPSRAGTSVIWLVSERQGSAKGGGFLHP